MSNDFTLGSVEVSSTPLQRFEEYLQSRGMRMTQPRRLLVDHVFSHHEHFDADQLLERLPKSGTAGSIGRATVYRTLNEFVEAGLLRKFTLGDRAVFEHDYGYPQHDHLYCKECEKLFEFQSEELLKLRDAIAQDQRFRVTSHRLIITGVCDECTKAKRRTKRKVDMI